LIVGPRFDSSDWRHALIRRTLARISWKHAVGEVCLIIIGILVALAVDAWWDRRQDAATEQAYLQQLLLDVDANDQAIRDVLNRHSAAVDAATRLATSFDAPGSLPSCEVMADMLLSALTWQPLELRTGTYSALLATGDIRLIRDSDLRAAVIRYAGVVDTVTRAVSQTEGEAWTTAQPFRRRVEFFWRSLEPRATSAPPLWAGCNFQPLRHDAEIREALFSTHLLHSNRIEAMKDLAGANDALRARLRPVVASR